MSINGAIQRLCLKRNKDIFCTFSWSWSKVVPRRSRCCVDQFPVLNFITILHRPTRITVNEHDFCVRRERQWTLWLYLVCYLICAAIERSAAFCCSNILHLFACFDYLFFLYFRPLCVALGFVPVVLGQTQFYGCDFYQPLELNRWYDVFSPQFPENYPPNSMCRWTGCAPYGSNILVNCTTMQLPAVCVPSIFTVCPWLDMENNRNDFFSYYYF